MNVFEAISGMNQNHGNCLLTVLTGERKGEKMLLLGQEPYWFSDENGFFMNHKEMLKNEIRGGMNEVDGQKIFCEPLGAEKKIVICGGGHVSMPVISIGKMIGCRVTVIEDRIKFADHARSRGADQVICDSFEHALAGIEGDEDTFFVIVTRGHRYDQECLRAIAGKKHAYIGMIGSRRRVAIVKQELRNEGIPAQTLEQVYTPIGLDIGAETPEEIAVAIMAEIIEVKNRKRESYGYSKEMLRILVSEDREKLALATIITRSGSAPRGVGTRMLIMPDGNCIGTIGGGCVESEVIQEARRMMNETKTGFAIHHVDMTGSDDPEEEGMVCGGVIDIMLEIV